VCINTCVVHSRASVYERILHLVTSVLTIVLMIASVAACCSVLQCVAVFAVCCSVLQCVAVCCSVLQSFAGISDTDTDTHTDDDTNTQKHRHTVTDIDTCLRRRRTSSINVGYLLTRKLRSCSLSAGKMPVLSSCRSAPVRFSIAEFALSYVCVCVDMRVCVCVCIYKNLSTYNSCAADIYIQGYNPMCALL